MSRDGERRGRTVIRDRDGANLSSFYRERFGSHSPEEYMNLRISHMDPRLDKEEVKDVLDGEFRGYGPFEVKIVRNPMDDQRLAYCNFERPEAARKIRRTMMDRLRKLLGSRLHVDPAGIIRDQDGKYIPDRYNRALQDRSGGGRGYSPPRMRRERSPIRPPIRNRRHDEPPPQPRRRENRLNHEDATRTLFVGNLPGDIRETEIRKIFERHGTVEEVDIKNPPETNAAYAFVLFETVEQAIAAKAEEQEEPIRGNRCKIGFGKSQVSNRLWIGALGDWCNEDLLLKEFDRFGSIENLEYVPGERQAYIRFTDTSAAAEACKSMRRFPLGGQDHRILVDFARGDDRGNRNGREISRERDSEKGGERRRRRRSSSGERASSDKGSEHSPRHKKRQKGPRTPPESPARSPVLTIQTVNDLEASVEVTWTGVVMLKKNEYPVRLHRVSGTDELTQKLLRDGEGEPLKLQITQRLPLGSQATLETKLLECSKKALSLLLAVPATDRPLKQLTHYLAEKDAAGVVSLPGGVLYVLGACTMADHLLAASAPGVSLMRTGADCILLVLALKS